MPDHENRHVVARREAVVEEHAMQRGLRGGLEIALLAQLADERVDQGLARLDPPPGRCQPLT